MTGSSLPPRRRFRGLEPAERVAQRREQLLDAGLEAFGTRGVHASGVREICAIAKLTERYFYESFKNRDALFVAVYERAVEDIQTRVTEAMLRADPKDPKELTRVGLRTALGIFRADPRVARVALIEVLSAGSGDRAFVVSQDFAELIGRMMTMLYPDAAQRYGLEQKIIANGLYGATIYIVMCWTLEGFREPLEAVVEHCALFFDSLATEMQARDAAMLSHPR